MTKSKSKAGSNQVTQFNFLPFKTKNHVRKLERQEGSKEFDQSKADHSQ